MGELSFNSSSQGSTRSSSPAQSSDRTSVINAADNLLRPPLEAREWDKWLANYQTGNWQRLQLSRYEELPAGDASVQGKWNGPWQSMTDEPGDIIHSLQVHNRHCYLPSPDISKMNKKKRVAALRRHGFTKPHHRPLLSRYTKHAQAVFRAPYAALFVASTNDHDMLVFSQEGDVDSVKTVPRFMTICAHDMLLKDEVLVVPDTREDCRFESLPSTLGVGFKCAEGGAPFYFYASAPLKLSTPSMDPRVSEEHVLVGRLCILDHQPRQFGEADRALLSNIASMTSEALENEFRGRQAAKTKRIQQTISFLASSIEDPDVLEECKGSEQDRHPPQANSCTDDNEDVSSQTPICRMRTHLVCDSLRQTLGASAGIAIDVAPLKAHKSSRCRRSNQHQKSVYPQMPWLAEGSPSQSCPATPPPMTASGGRVFGMSPDLGTSGISTSPESSAPRHTLQHTRSSSSGAWLPHRSDEDPIQPTIDPDQFPRLRAFAGPSSARVDVENGIAARELRDFLVNLQSMLTNEWTSAQFYSTCTEETLHEQEGEDCSEASQSETSTTLAESNPLASILPKDTAMYATVPIFTAHGSQPLVLLVVTFKELVALDTTDLLFLNAAGSILHASIMRQQAGATEKAQLRFIQAVQHELRTPLHGILGITEFLRHSVGNKALSAEAEKAGLSEDRFLTCCLDMIKRAGSGLSSLLDDVLDFGQVSGVHRSDSANNQDPAQVINLGWLVEEVATAELENARMVKQHQGAFRIDTEVNVTMPEMIIGIQDDIRQWSWAVQVNSFTKILQKIISNALRFTMEGSVEIVVGLSQGQRNGQKEAGEEEISLIIQDTGAGMTQAFVDDGLLNPFVKSNSFMPGAGLGMTLAASHINALRGTLHVSSHLHKGTRISVILLARRMQKIDVQPLCFRVQNAGGAGKAQVNSVYFVGVDDTHVLRKMLQRFLLSRDILEVSDVKDADLVVIEGSHDTKDRPLELQHSARLVLLQNSAFLAQQDLSRFDGHAMHAMKSPFGPGELLRLDSFLHDATPMILKQPIPPIPPKAPSANGAPAKHPSSTLQVPDSPSRAAESVPHISNVIRAGAEPGSEKEFRVLAVEDNPINMRLLTSTLKKLGYMYEEAKDGVEAVVKYISFRPSVVLLDISLPRQDGFEACMQMRRHSLEHTPRIVAITALSSPQDQQRGIDICGMDEWRTKPVSPRTLFADLQHWHAAWLDAHLSSLTSAAQPASIAPQV